MQSTQYDALKIQWMVFLFKCQEPILLTLASRPVLLASLAYDPQFCLGPAYGVSLVHVQAFQAYLKPQEEITYTAEPRLDSFGQVVCLDQEFSRYLFVFPFSHSETKTAF